MKKPRHIQGRGFFRFIHSTTESRRSAEENEIQFQDPDVTVEAAPKDTYSNEGAEAEP